MILFSVRTLSKQSQKSICNVYKYARDKNDKEAISQTAKAVWVCRQVVSQIIEDLKHHRKWETNGLSSEKFTNVYVM